MATVQRIDQLNPETLCVWLSCPDITHYRAGQYVRVFVNEHTARSYSLASTPGIDHELHLHIRRGTVGSASRRFHDEIEEGDAIHISTPRGGCCYRSESLDQPVLMIATGTGLAPLYGVVRAALQQGHRGPIHLYHGARHREELYLVEQLQALTRLHPNFSYVPCVSRGVAVADCRAGRALDIALGEIALSEDWQVYLSGNPDMVNDAWQAVCAVGVLPQFIHSDLVKYSAAILSAQAV